MTPNIRLIKSLPALRAHKRHDVHAATREYDSARARVIRAPARHILLHDDLPARSVIYNCYGRPAFRNARARRKFDVRIYGSMRHGQFIYICKAVRYALRLDDFGQNLLVLAS